jgi:hypothetical protein
MLDANNEKYLRKQLACLGPLAAKEGQQIHGLIVNAGLKTIPHVESGLMDVYSKCGLMEDALGRKPDGSFLTVILFRFDHNGLQDNAVKLFVT